MLPETSSMVPRIDAYVPECASLDDDCALAVGGDPGLEVRCVSVGVAGSCYG